MMRKGSGIVYNEVAPPAKSAYAPPGKEFSFISELDIDNPVGETSNHVIESPKVNDGSFLMLQSLKIGSQIVMRNR